MPLNVNTWHARGGLSDNTKIIYAEDGYGNLYPVGVGEDPAGNPILVSEDTPLYYNLASQGIQTVNSIFGGGGRRGNYDQGAAVAVTAAPQGITAGLSSNTLLLIGVVAAFFLLGKRR